MKSTNKRVKLDWSKMLGFNQVKSPRRNSGSSEAKAIVGAKIGTKGGGTPPA